MSYKLGQRVRVIEAADGAHGADGQTGVVTNDHATNGCGHGIRLRLDSDSVWHIGYEHEVRLELLDSIKPYERKTYRLKKAMPGVPAGALFQEMCDDGTQPYRPLQDVAGLDLQLSDRKHVEENPQWFVEVFKVTPEYMTREELDQWEAFKARKKPGRKAATVQQSVETRVRRKKRGETARRSAAMKAVWARRKAAQSDPAFRTY